MAQRRPWSRQISNHKIMLVLFHHNWTAKKAKPYSQKPLLLFVQTLQHSTMCHASRWLGKFHKKPNYCCQNNDMNDLGLVFKWLRNSDDKHNEMHNDITWNRNTNAANNIRYKRCLSAFWTMNNGIYLSNSINWFFFQRDGMMWWSLNCIEATEAIMNKKGKLEMHRLR